VPERKMCTPESLFEMCWVSDPQLAPDGQRVAYVEHWIEEVEKESKKRPAYRSALFLSDGPDRQPRRLTYTATGNDRMPRWSPDGRELAFVSTRDGDKPQLYVLDLAGGEAQQITRTKELSEGVQEFSWHPSGVLFCFTSNGHRDEEERKYVELHDEKVYENHLPFKFEGEGLLDKRRAQLYRINRDGSECTQVTNLPRAVSMPLWSPDGQQIAFISQNEATPEHVWITDLFVINADGMELRQLTRSLGPISSHTWSPDGAGLAYMGHDRRHGLATTSKMWLVDLLDGEPRCITDSFDGEIGDIASGDAHLGSQPQRPVWAMDSRITFVALVKGQAGLYRVPAEGGAVELINTSGLSLVNFTQRDDMIAFAGETNARAAEVYTMRIGKQPQRRSHAADAFFSTYRIQPPEHVEFTSTDGQAIEGWVIRPIAADEDDRKHPLILYIHGGPHTAYGNGFIHEFQVLAAAGFGVFFTNPRGSSSYGEAFADAVRRHFGEKDYEDVMSAADLATSWEWVDPQRIGVAGGSYGGYMTNWIVTHTDRFAAACTQRSISNLLSFAGTSDVGPEFICDEFGALPWTDEAILLAKSPIRYVKHVKTPMLILHQEEDQRCPIEQAEQLYTALVELGVPVKFVRFPEEGHELLRSGQPQRRVNRMHHIVDWFTRYLLKEPRTEDQEPEV
jgi:dipeptidyl aminopeptidase/acylaminoacyl peptidase